MTLKKIIGALALVGMSAGAVANDQVLNLTATQSGFSGTATETSGFVPGHSMFSGSDQMDVLSIAGLDFGKKYFVTLSLTGANAGFDLVKIGQVNNFAKVSDGLIGGYIETATFAGDKVAPFSISLFTTNTTPVSNGFYSASVTAALVPVPEPESYAMLLAGLGIMGAVARRRIAAK